ncbi:MULTISPECIES: [protein-PII] uridylyltransferase [unclassified Corynebacterium]|uniref:[protein-PII] uridylyltransferase n=1 Tax=unclassified Corynebacterium TaxID=2624378 RepID=UPI0029CA2263|nr:MULTISPECIES: [protein-PII] uridylyltransferase [unclassified Corynebacterium]WPF65361.1 [protein-PII] uridylyltransferase [Corynebacterium sp. 22KM0430]WPF67856.1 [protein-PII] uridylyltransferase [Corynebacterium sp. 21KM1197]
MKHLLESLEVPEGCALAATGSVARGEATEYSDIDLILLHPEGSSPSREQVERLWYPIWDAGQRLDHSVRSPTDCAELITQEVTAALALLDLRHLRGEEALSARCRERVLRTWRRELSRNFTAVVDTAIARWRRSGSLVTMTRPDLKHGRGGLRDIELLRALALGNVCDMPDLSAERALLLDVRAHLHRQARRRRDVLDPEFAAEIALDLGFADRYALGRALAAGARRVEEELTAALAQARDLLVTRTRKRIRRPLDVDVVEDSGEIVLARQPRLDDPALLLRVGASAARTGLPVAPRTWAQLAVLPPLPERLTRQAALDFLSLLNSPEHSAPVIRQMDARGLWERVVPEWAHIRGRMPAEPSHSHTIDEHTLGVLARCASAKTTVARPDLLLLAALYHDIGKGRSRPHELVGAELVARMGTRLGLNLRERSCVQTLVAEHTTLARLVATRDTGAEETVDELLRAVHYDLLTLELLTALAPADAQATGPGVWNRRLAHGIAELSGRARRHLTALSPTPPLVSAPANIGIRDRTVYWRSTEGKGLSDVLAVIAAKAWTIDAARILTQDTGQVHAEFEVRSTVHATLDTGDFVHAYQSGVYRDLPEVTSPHTDTYWYGAVVEVRTTDSVGALGAVAAALAPAQWLTMRNVGGTMIVQARLGRERADHGAVEREIARAMGGNVD